MCVSLRNGDVVVRYEAKSSKNVANPRFVTYEIEAFNIDDVRYYSNGT